MTDIEKGFQRLSYDLDLLTENEKLKSALRIRTWLVIITLLVYGFILASIMNNHQKWYKKGKQDGITEQKKRNELIWDRTAK